MILNSDSQELPNNFTFKKSKIQSSFTKETFPPPSTTDGPIIDSKEMMPSKSSTLARKRAISQDHNYAPKHSFERLVWDGVKGGPSATMIVQETFWNQIKLEAKQFAENLNNTKDLFDNTTTSDYLEDNDEFNRLDKGIPFPITLQFFLTRKQFEDSIVSLVQNHLFSSSSSSTTTNVFVNYLMAEQLIIDGILVSINEKGQHISQVNIESVNLLPPTSVCSADSTDNPFLTSNDALDCGMHVTTSSINTIQFIPLIDYAVRVGNTDLAHQLYKIAIIQITNWNHFEAGSLKVLPLPQLNVFKTMETNKYALGLYEKVINQHSQYFDLDFMKKLYHQLISLSLDLHIYNNCWLQLKLLMKRIIEWMDISRLHFLIEWTMEFGLKTFISHSNRILNLLRLFDMTDIEQLAVKFILDAALFGIDQPKSSSLLNAELANEDGTNDDYKFLTSLPQMIRLPWISSTVELEMIILLSLNRLLRTRLESTYYHECQILYDHIDMLRNGIPSNHVPVNIRLRDNLAKMKTYLQSYFTSKKQGIIAINVKNILDRKTM